MNVYINITNNNNNIYHFRQIQKMQQQIIHLHNNNTPLPLIIIATLLYFYIYYCTLVTFTTKKNQQQKSTKNIYQITMITLMFINPISYQQIMNNTYQMIRVMLIVYYMVYIASNNSNEKNNDNKNMVIQTTIQLVIIGVIGGWSNTIVIAANSFKIYWNRHDNKYVIKTKDSSSHTSKEIRYRAIKSIIYLVLSLYLELNINQRYQSHFTDRFKLGVNLMPLLYSHTFTRYIPLLQSLIFCCPYFIILPLMSVPIIPELKLIICYFFSIFCSSALSLNTQLPALVGLYILQFWGYKWMVRLMQSDQFMIQLNNNRNNDKNKNDNTIKQNEDRIYFCLIYINQLVVVCSIVSISGYYILQHFYWLYNNTHVAGISYLLAGSLIFWIPHVLQITQGIAMMNPYINSFKSSDKNGIKIWLKNKIKQM